MTAAVESVIVCGAGEVRKARVLSLSLSDYVFIPLLFIHIKILTA